MKQIVFNQVRVYISFVLIVVGASCAAYNLFNFTHTTSYVDPVIASLTPTDPNEQPSQEYYYYDFYTLKNLAYSVGILTAGFLLRKQEKYEHTRH